MIRQRFASFSLLLLLLISACEQVSAPITEEGPTIIDFSASPLDADGSATLSWRVNDATSLSIDQNVGDVTGQSNFTVTPQQTTTYTLSATNSEGSSSAQATVTVSGASPNPSPGNDTTAPTGSFGVSRDADPPFQNDSGADIEGEGDSRIVRVAPGGTFYAQVAYEDPSGIADIEVNLVNGSPDGIRGTLDPNQGFFTLGEPTGTCDLSSNPVSVTCVYPVTATEDAVNIDELDGSGGEFAYVFRTQVTDAAGNTSDEAIRGYVIVTEDTDAPETPGNRAPTADFTSEQQENSLSVKFSAQASSDPDGDSLSYAWDFGDGGAGSSRDFTKTYEQAGDYEVTLTVSDGQGGEDTETKTVTVEPTRTAPNENVAPQVEIEEVDPLTLSGDSVSASLQATVTDPDSDSFTYTWNITEGDAENVTLASRNKEDTGVSFSATGSYTLTLTVSDGDKEGKGSVTVEVKASGGEPENPTCTSPVNIPDEELEGAIREQLGKPEGDLTCENLATLSELSYQGDIEFGPTVESLEGLQYAVNLERLRLNEIAPGDYSPIANLTKLETLDLQNSSRGDLSFLTNLTNLVELNLGSYLFGNRIDDITPLQNLKKLEKLNLAGFYEIALPSGDIEDISPLEGLTNLTELDLGGQPVTDLSPLVANSGLGEGDKIALGGAMGGGLDDICYDETYRADVEALRERGVNVDTNFDDYPTCKSEPDGNITVTSTSGAASLADECTLRAAITAANTDQAVGGCPAGSGADTVVLAEGATYTLTEIDNGADEPSGPSGLPRVTSEIEVEGNGATVERSDAEDTPFFRLFYVADTGDLEVENATVRRGMLDILNNGEPTIFGPNFLNLGALTLTDVVVSEGSLNDSQAGKGAISIHNSGTLTMTRSEVKNNGFSVGTFSIFNADEATITESSVSSDARGSDGLSSGAIYNAESGKLTLERSAVTGHYTFGTTAGVENDGQAIIVDSVVADNSSDQRDGGLLNTGVMEIERSLIANNGGGDGGTGGIFNDGKLTLLSSTVSSNSSEFEFSGGAIYNSDGATLDVRYSTIKDNATGDDNPDDDLSDNAIFNVGAMTFRGAILENSSVNCEGPGTFISEGYNLDSDGSCNLNQSTDLSNVDPELGELEDNGGPTPTHALQEGSPAINAIPTSACEVDTDQRGVSRPQGEACDIGAFELE